MKLGLFTSMTTHGGVERVGRHVGLILEMMAAEEGLPCRLLALNDPVGEHRLHVGEHTIRIEGFGGHKARFILAALYMRRRATLVYLGHPHLAPFLLLLKLRRRGTTNVVSVHGVEVWERLALIRRLGLRRAHVLVSPSAFTADKIHQIQGVSKELVKVAPHALDPRLAALASDRESRASRRLGYQILSVGRLHSLEPGKGIDTVISALGTVRAWVPHVRYVVVGEGDDIPRLARLAESSGVADVVTFSGSVASDRQLADHYRASDVFALPSTQEGFGIVVIEAMAFGLPVVAADHGPMREIIEHGKTGFLVAPGDTEGLASKILLLIEDKELASRVGQAAREFALSRFSFGPFESRWRGILGAGSDRPLG